MKVLIDMNLTPLWVQAFQSAGIDSIHWSHVGNANAPDKEIFDWAGKNNHVVFTHDLDFGTLLAAYNTSFPSVIQVRTQDVTPENLLYTVTTILKKFTEHVEKGALITIDENKSRIRILPIR